ncbi:MAG: 3-isopropylmalate dehydratase small subunit [Treponema sp.]|nr:3-isopropylmalate dehydratase small subunit [Treponema sp.]
MKTFGGAVLFLDRSDINTDEIILDKYLKELPKQELKSHLFEELKIEGFNSQTDVAGTKVIITRENFGCGAVKENSSWALETNGIYTVVAPTFSKTFRQEMFTNALMAIEIDRKSLADMFRTFANKDTECKIVINDDGTAKVKLIAGSLSKSYPFELNDDEKNLLANDGWIGFAESKY